MLPNQAQILLLLLVTVAATAARLAITEPGTVWYLPLLAIGGYAMAAAILAVVELRTRWFTRTQNREAVLSRVGLVIAGLLLLVPFVEGGTRIFSAYYLRPLEQVTLVALTNFAFFAVVVSHVRPCRGAAIAISFVLVMASLMLGESPAIVPLVAAYSGLAVVGLANVYWRSVQSDRASMGLPLAPVLALTMLLAGVTAASTSFASGLPSIWAEWVPASGGTSGASPDALLGVGEGDWVVSGPNARSTGSVDSDYFLESDLPTLYDVIMEAYGEPRKPEDIRKAIFMAKEQLLRQDQHKAADKGDAGRQFSLYRQGRPSRADDSSDADALLYVEGRTPLHLAMKAYEYFDGIAWHEPVAQDQVCRLESRESDVSWLWLPVESIGDFFAGTERHQLRFGQLSSARLPLPNHPERFRLGRADSENVKRWAVDILSWAQDGILQARQCLPPGTFVEVESRTIDRGELLQSSFAQATVTSKYLAVPDHLRDSAGALADQFSSVAPGWQQVDAVLAHLRAHYAHEREATVPSTCTDPIHHFLHEAKGGPAYQFATTAALALRSMGYPTRVVSGFYASPASYVARTGQTPVRVQDAHVWIEVKSPDGGWITLDPTPGYETAWHRPGLLERAEQFASAVAAPLFANPLASASGLFLSIGLWWRRLLVQERLLTMLCLWFPYRSTRRHVAATLRLLDLRSVLAGHARPGGQTPMAWYGKMDDSGFVTCLYRTLYGGATRSEAADDRATCHAAVRTIGTKKLRNSLGTA